MPYECTTGSIATLDKNIYLFGGAYNSNSARNYSQRAYKVDISTGTYTRLTDIPTYFVSGAATAIGSFIYLFGSTSGNSFMAYRYNTTNNTYTQLTNMPTSGVKSAITIGTNYIYLFAATGAYKYNTQTYTYTQLTNMPFSYTNRQGAVAVGTDIYLFGSDGTGSTTSYKYNTQTDTYTQLANIPFNFNGAISAIGNDIYLIQRDTNYYYVYIYKYNITTNTYTQLPGNLYTRQGSILSTAISNYIYILISMTSEPSYKYGGITHSTYLTKKLQIELTGANLYNNSTKLSLPAYYGDGTNWNSL